MDVQMPEMDGTEAVRLIRERGGTKQPFIVALTAEALRVIEKGSSTTVSTPI